VCHLWYACFDTCLYINKVNDITHQMKGFVLGFSVNITRNCDQLLQLILGFDHVVDQIKLELFLYEEF